MGYPSRQQTSHHALIKSPFRFHFSNQVHPEVPVNTNHTITYQNNRKSGETNPTDLIPWMFCIVVAISFRSSFSSNSIWNMSMLHIQYNTTLEATPIQNKCNVNPICVGSNVCAWRTATLPMAFMVIMFSTQQASVVCEWNTVALPILCSPTIVNVGAAPHWKWLDHVFA